MSGKRKMLPCGHVGEAVIGQYYACPICDRSAALEHGDDRVTKPMCGECGSVNLRIWPGFTTDGRDFWFCVDCTKSTWS